MYSPTDLKKNTLITLDGEPYKVVEYAQKVMGRGGSIVNVRLKNLISSRATPSWLLSNSVSATDKPLTELFF